MDRTRDRIACRMLAVSLLALLVAGCPDGGGGDDSGGPATPSGTADRLGIGTASASLAVDANGCTRDEVRFTSDEGRELRLPIGCLRPRDPDALARVGSGDWTLTVRPADVPVVDADEAGLQSAYHVELDDPSGSRVRATFEPPLEIEVPRPTEPGHWQVVGYAVGREWSDSQAGAIALPIDALGATPEGALVVIRQTGLLGIELGQGGIAPRPLSRTGLAQPVESVVVVPAPPETTHTRILEGASTLDFRSYTLINRDSAQIVGVTWADTLYGVVVGESLSDVSYIGVEYRALYRDDGDSTAVMALSTAAENALVVRAYQRLLDPNNGNAVIDDALTFDDMTGGCPEATCVDALYVGRIITEMTVLGNSANLFIATMGEVEDQLGSEEYTVLRYLEATDSGLRGIFDIYTTASTAAVLERLPSDWSGLPGERRLTLFPPPPVEVTLSLAGEGEGTGRLDAGPAPMLSCNPVPPLTCTTEFLTIFDGEVEIEATPAEDSVFAGWEGCPDPLLGSCFAEWFEDDGMVTIDVAARFELLDDGACNSAYGGAPGYLPCSGAPAGQCKFYVVLDDVRSCDDACQAGGGTCVQAQRDVNDGCSGSIPRACNDPANDRICYCTLPD